MITFSGVEISSTFCLFPMCMEKKNILNGHKLQQHFGVMECGLTMKLLFIVLLEF